ncbi:Bromodomain-containing protein [Rhypophila decipiens]
MKGETHESTSAYGLVFLEMIRRTKDKSGRTVADYFENLLPKEGNEDYYKRVRMPISLKTIEKKLHNQDFANLAELEGFFKRMVMNAKEYYHKGSDIFEDAERVRKALSNYMTKTNPAYKLIPNYSCTATPIPTEGVMEEEQQSQPTRIRTKVSRKAEPEEDGDDDEDAEGDEEDEEDDDDDDDEDVNSRRIVLKRRGTGRSSKGSESPAPRAGGRNSRAKADHEYEGVPYRGLNFQQAQEKIVEELIRKPDGSDPYFLDFINLPPRSFKDYFSVIANPLSLKGLQKLVKGIHGRKPATGVSDFKSWQAFADRASLLWTNAHYYNEEGSEIHKLATVLKECFEKELSAAKAVVPEPPQPKIKLKVPGQETPVTGPKKITIHVGGSRSSAAPSPAPPTGQSSDSNRTDGPALNGGRSGPLGPGAGVLPLQLDKTRTGSVASPVPLPMASFPKAESGVQQLPGAPARVNGVGPGTVNRPNGSAVQHFAPVQPLQNGHPQHPIAPPAPPAPAPSPIYDRKLRAPGKGVSDALIKGVLVRTHPTIPLERTLERRFRLEIPAHPRFSQQNITVHLPVGHFRLQLIPRIAYLEQQERQYRIFVAINNQFVGRATPLPIPDDPLPPNAMVFECNLQAGTNQITVTMIAALPKGQKLPGGEDCELERVTINAYLPKP